MSDLSYMDQNVAQIRERIEAAKKRRDPSLADVDVMLLAAIKYTDAEHVNYLHRVLGVHDVGENRVQQLLGRWDALDREGLRMHFIGKLQSNKVKYIIDKVVMIHSLDSHSLAREIERQAAKHDLTMDVLVEINSGREENKGGVMPEDARAAVRDFDALPGIRVRGLMTMAPVCADIEDSRKYFRETYAIFIDIFEKNKHNIIEPILSMGMSSTYGIAIEEGATEVRVGQALFGHR